MRSKAEITGSYPWQVSSNFFILAAVMTSVLAFIGFFVGMMNEGLWVRFLLLLAPVVVFLTVAFFVGFEFKWMVFDEEAVRIRGGNGLIEIRRDQVKSLSIFRSLKDEESIFTKAYRIELILNRSSCLFDELSVNGFELTETANGETVVTMGLSGMNFKENELRDRFDEWLA